MRYPFLIFMFLLLNTTNVYAHKLVVYAYLEQETVKSESTFSNGKPVINSQIKVFTKESRQLVIQGKTDSQGMFKFPLTKRLKAFNSDLLFELSAGEGHKATWTLSFEELTGSIPESSKPTRPKTPSWRNILFGLFIIFGVGITIKLYQQIRKRKL